MITITKAYACQVDDRVDLMFYAGQGEENILRISLTEAQARELTDSLDIIMLDRLRSPRPAAAVTPAPADPGDTIMTFGKHRGVPVKHLTPQYCQWLFKQSGLFEAYPEIMQAIDIVQTRKAQRRELASFTTAAIPVKKAKKPKTKEQRKAARKADKIRVEAEHKRLEKKHAPFLDQLDHKLRRLGDRPQ